MFVFSIWLKVWTTNKCWTDVCLRVNYLYSNLIRLPVLIIKKISVIKDSLVANSLKTKAFSWLICVHYLFLSFTCKSFPFVTIFKKDLSSSLSLFLALSSTSIDSRSGKKWEHFPASHYQLIAYNLRFLFPLWRSKVTPTEQLLSVAIEIFTFLYTIS